MNKPYFFYTLIKRKLRGCSSSMPVLEKFTPAIGLLLVFFWMSSLHVNAQTGTCPPAGDFAIDANLYSVS